MATYKHWSPTLEELRTCAGPEKCQFGAVEFPDDATPEKYQRLTEMAIESATKSSRIGIIGGDKRRVKAAHQEAMELAGEIVETKKDGQVYKYAPALEDEKTFTDYMKLKGEENWTDKDTLAIPKNFRGYLYSFDKDKVRSMYDPDSPSRDEVIANLGAHKRILEKNQKSLTKRVEQKYSNFSVTSNADVYENGLYPQFQHDGLYGSKCRSRAAKNRSWGPDSRNGKEEYEQLKELSNFEYVEKEHIGELVALNYGDVPNNTGSRLRRNIIEDRYARIDKALEDEAEKRDDGSTKWDLNPDSVVAMKSYEEKILRDKIPTSLPKDRWEDQSYSSVPRYFNPQNDDYDDYYDDDEGIYVSENEERFDSFIYHHDTSNALRKDILIDRAKTEMSYSDSDRAKRDIELSKQMKDMSSDESAKFLFERKDVYTAKPIIYAQAIKRDPEFEKYCDSKLS